MRDDMRVDPSSAWAGAREALFGAAAGDLPPARAVLLAVWFGMLLGVGEAAHAVVTHWIQPKPVWAYSSSVVWMAPLAAVTIFTVLGLGAAGLLLARPSLIRLRTAATAFAFVVWYASIRLSFAGVYRTAALLLAAGLAVQTGRLILARRQRFWPVCRRSLAATGGVVVLIGTLVHGSAWLAGRRYVATRPSITKEAPNVLLLILDTVRSQSLSLYGYDRPTTPNIDSYATTGVVFERAVAPAPWTLPSHASMFTGRHAGEVSADWASPLGDSYPTLAEVLHEAGYITAGFVANMVYTTAEVGLDRGFAVFEDHPRSIEMVIQQSWLARKIAGPVRGFVGDTDLLARKSAEDVNAQFLHWLDRLTSRGESAPHFAFLNYYDAHGPYLPPEPFRARFGAGDPLAGLDEHQRVHDPNDLSRLRDGYDDALAYLDVQIDNLLDSLAARGTLEHTVVIITSDHGEEFGEHEIIDHGNSLYMPALHVPLIISYPASIPSGLRIGSPIELRDLAATVLDLVGQAPNLPGESLARFWNPDSAGRLSDAALSEVTRKPWNIPEWFPIARGDMQSLVIESYHYIRHGDGSEELYNIALDPWESDDLAATVEGSELLPVLRSRLAASERR